MCELYSGYYLSPIGPVQVICSDVGVVSVKFVEEMKETAAESNEMLENALLQLKEYFGGKRKAFDLELVLEGTEFQKRVWNELQEIPYGSTWSYKELAVRAGNEKAVRAVGRANGRNPVWIVLPCHRVIGSSGDLTGYAGGVDRKRWLLEHESKNR